MRSLVYAVVPSPVATNESIDALFENHLFCTPRDDVTIDIFTEDDISAMREKFTNDGYNPSYQGTDVEFLYNFHYPEDYRRFINVKRTGHDANGKWFVEIERSCDFHPNNPWDSVFRSRQAHLVARRDSFLVGDFHHVVGCARKSARDIASCEYDRLEIITQGLHIGESLEEFCETYFLENPQSNGIWAFFEYSKQPWVKAAAASRGDKPDPTSGCEHDRYFINNGGREAYIAHSANSVLNPSSLVLSDGRIFNRNDHAQWCDFILEHIRQEPDEYTVVALEAYLAQ